MTTARLENLAFDTEQRHRSAHVLPKLPPAADKTPQTAHGTRQQVVLKYENSGQARFGVIMLRKMVDDVRRPKPNGEIPANAAGLPPLRELRYMWQMTLAQVTL